jgi:hypothetical protein
MPLLPDLTGCSPRGSATLQPDVPTGPFRLMNALVQILPNWQRRWRPSASGSLILHSDPYVGASLVA